MHRSNSFLLTMLFLSGLLWSGCQTPFTPPLHTAPLGYLVVEGSIGNEGKVTRIRLSRTRTVSDTSHSDLVDGAQLSIQDNLSHTYPLYNTGDGLYYSQSLQLTAGNFYRLAIQTPDGKTYQSALVQLKVSPPMDSVYWNLNPDGVNIYVDTHDPSGKSVYYKWDFDETWEFHTHYVSYLQYNDKHDLIYALPPDEQIYTCWGHDSSSDIMLANTLSLNQDRIHAFALQSIPYHDEKLSVLYSIRVRQEVLDTTEYTFWSDMKANNENVGSIFDHQPFVIKGNITCTSDPSVPVIGYVGACIAFQKRYFISNQSLPDGWNIMEFCTPTYVSFDSVKAYWAMGYYPIVKNLTNYMEAKAHCVDCRMRGVNHKPAFWP